MPASDRVRLADIAAKAHVSTATVSRVFAGKSLIAADTRDAVLAAAAELGYVRPQALTRQVGLIVPEMSNPVFPAIAQAAEALLVQAGLNPLLCVASHTSATEDEYVQLLLTQGVAGLVFVYGLHTNLMAETDRYDLLRAKGVPFVLIGGHRDGIDAPCAAVNDVGAIASAVRYLADLGHSRIGLANGSDWLLPARRKREGFTAGLVELGLVSKPADAMRHVASTTYSVDGGQAAANELLSTGHTAIICASDLMALGAIRAVRARGLDVPADVSVVGFDDSTLMAFTDPPLTTVRQPVPALCQAAISSLLTQMRGEQVSRTEVLIDSELVVRDSTAPAPSAR